MKLLILFVLVLCSISNSGAVTKPCGKITEIIAEVTHHEYDGFIAYHIMFPIKYRESRLTAASIQYGSPYILSGTRLESHSEEYKVVRVISSPGHENFSISANYSADECIRVNSIEISPWDKQANDN